MTEISISNLKEIKFDLISIYRKRQISYQIQKFKIFLVVVVVGLVVIGDVQSVENPEKAFSHLRKSVWEKMNFLYRSMFVICWDKGSDKGFLWGFIVLTLFFV